MQTPTPHLTLKEKQRQERENLILQTAEEVLEEKGYYETSMDEIATRVGIAKGTIYTHFPSKEELVATIFARDMQKFLQGFDAILEAELTPRARLENIMSYLHEGLYGRRAKLLSSTYTGVDLKRLVNEKRGSIREMWECLISKVSKLLDEGKAVGEFRTDVSTRVMLFMMLSLFSPRAHDHVLLEHDLTPDELLQQLKTLCFYGMTQNQPE
ncbi:hypothetical protein KSC_086480 [Ktedonobacter sp. SOSP1-52]|uniref:TetR/AcrR family transcriptional regulator n=1 Tax=Ktedonobacter sp. SOSP1-52 TaxID=2778366 RepID=UPI001916BE66|nr:TetR/AcrR family transcriptional regulator [Ktedonobacter sp. SOSP1-52]GHO69756.1 hypothetical protein KSC_086480 [Ktedonobacter sp. SOSP1-52]